ncbi:MAG TPA: SPOR domain-containing protein [Sphingomonas sp.]|uniref:SPOR domain-containing protein n=1 Tax=Sphingomonas sp. TaxID=28214 RepID=UPI002BE053B5|nr:SPOR domain-containing protein [Sphingomonas sp.]HMI18328.1 SPOR domain-containing protein [Sphingomonas sp.]
MALLVAVGTLAVTTVSAAPDIQGLQARAQAGDAEAEFQLGEAYRAGRGVAPDPESAIMWYRRATVAGHIRASEELGFALFAHGDRREAMPYIEKAAARGEARAFYLLGTAHFNGDYASRDWPLAYAQTMRAAAAGLAAAQKNLELMDHYLLPQDKAKADQILATLPSVRSGGQADSGASAPAAKAPPAPVQSADATAKPAKPAKAPKTPPKTPAKVVAATVATAAAPEAAPGGSWKVQLGAFGSADRARDRWKTLSAKVSALGAYDQHIVAAGSVQRLQAGNIASKTEAQVLCKKVVAAGGDCLVIAP